MAAAAETLVVDDRFEQRAAAAAASRERTGVSTRSVWATVFVVWGVSRGFFFAIGAVGHYLVPRADVAGDYPDSVGTLSYWAHWDGRWFAHIAVHGYDSVLTTAFEPLYPLLVGASVKAGLGVAVSGVLLSSAATLAAFYFVFELGRLWHGERAAFVGLLALAFFPTAFYFNAVYSEALFLALTAGTLWAIYVRRDLLLAGLFAYFATLTRDPAILLVLPLAYEWLRHRRKFGWIGLAAVAAPIAGTASYLLYLRFTKGESALLRDAYEDRWGRPLGNPLETFGRALEHSADGVLYLWPPHVFSTPSIQPAYLLSNTLNVWFLLFAACALVLAVRRLPVGALLYAIPAVLGPLAFGEHGNVPLISYPRYPLVIFPLFIVIGAVLARSRVAVVIWLTASAVLGAYLTMLFASWRWVA